MNVNCPHCLALITKADRKQFIEDKATEWLNCRSCGEKYYLVVPECARFRKHLILVLLAIPMLAICIAVLAFYLDLKWRGKIPGVPIIVLLPVAAGMYFLFIAVMRHVHWALAEVQDNPYTWD